GTFSASPPRECRWIPRERFPKWKQVISPAIVTVPARQQVAQFVNELFGSEAIGAGFRGSLRMQSTTPFAAIGLRFSGSVFSTLPVTPNVTVPGRGSLILPQFAIAGGWATQIALVNTS